MKLQVKPNGQAVITVPKSMRNAKDWEDGEKLEWKLDNEGNLKLREKDANAS